MHNSTFKILYALIYVSMSLKLAKYIYIYFFRKIARPAARNFVSAT